MRLKSDKQNRIKFKLKILTSILHILTLTLTLHIGYGQQTNVLLTDTNKSFPIINTIQGQMVLNVCDKMPQFVGGDEAKIKYLLNAIRYPPLTDNEIFQSTVRLTFIIDTNGKVSNVSIIDKINYNDYSRIEKESIKAIENMPDWIPGENKGKKVPVRLKMPIHFEPSQ